MHEDEATQREKKISRNLAIGIHVVIIALFIFGVSWHRRQSEPAAVADLWSTMSPPKHEAPREPPLKIAPRIEKEPPPAPAPPPPPPKPEVKAAPKPDIALKEKAEKERKLKEEVEHKKELERRKEEEAKKLKAQQAAELKKKEDEKRRVAEQQELERKKEEEAKRQAAERNDAAAKAAAAAQSRANDRYISLIQARIRNNIVEPPNLQGNPQVEFDVIQIPGGEVLSVRMTRSSGVPAYDSAVERAIMKASPLPSPPEPSMFQRELHLKIRPRE